MTESAPLPGPSHSGTAHAMGRSKRTNLRLAVVTMQFPAPSETFAARDLRAWNRRVAHLGIHCLRSAHQNQDKLQSGYQVGHLAIRCPSVGGQALAVARLLRRPGALLGLLARVLRDDWRSPIRLVKALVLLPRAAEIAWRVVAERAQVLHCYWGHYPSLVVTVLEAYAARPAVVSQFLGAYDLETELGSSLRVAHNADLVWTHAQANLRAFRALGLGRIQVQVNRRGIDLAEIDRAVPARTIERDLDLLTVARLAPGKGIDRTLHALADLRERDVRLSLSVAGDGPQRGTLERLATALGVGEQVRFLGYLEPVAVFALMLRTRIFVLLSDAAGERLPNAVKEALYLGCYCLVGRSIGIDELMPASINGRVIDHHQNSRVRQALLAAHREPPDPVRQARSREWIRENFSVEASADRYVGAWSQAAAGAAQTQV